MLGERRDDIHIAGMAGDGERIEVRVQVALGLVFGMEVNVQHLDAHVRKVLAEEGQGLRTVDELDLQLLEGMHMDDALQELEDDQHDHASDQRDFRKAVTRRKADTRHAPQGSCGGQAGDFTVTHDDGTRAEETNAGYDGGGDAARAHVDEAARAQLNHAADGLLLDDGDHRRAHANQHMRTHACGAVFDFAVDTDDRADEYDNEQPEANVAQRQQLSEFRKTSNHTLHPLFLYKNRYRKPTTQPARGRFSL